MTIPIIIKDTINNNNINENKNDIKNNNAEIINISTTNEKKKK